MERLVKSFKKGSIYGIGARPFIDKTKFCISIVSLIASKGNKVLYMSHEMDEDAFTEKLTATCPNVIAKINFEEVYKMTIEGLEMFASEEDYDLIVLDPFDIYSLDLDIGDLKDFAKKKNIAILLTTNLARPPIFSKRKHPVLSDIKFIDKRAQRKFIAYIDIILFLERKPHTNDLKVLVGKDNYREIGGEINLE